MPLLEVSCLHEVATNATVRLRFLWLTLLTAMTFAACDGGAHDATGVAATRSHNQAFSFEAPDDSDTEAVPAVDDVTSDTVERTPDAVEGTSDTSDVTSDAAQSESEAMEDTSDAAAASFKYLALGDSFSASVEGNLLSLATCAGRSNSAWPRLLFKSAIATKDRSAAMTFRACSGATTAVLASQYPSRVAPFTGPDTIITVTIGGNDIKVSSEVLNCLKTDCESREQAINDTIDQVAGPNLRAAFADLKATFPSATIVAVGYPFLFAQTVNNCIGGKITQAEASMIRRAIGHMNSEINLAAEEAGISVVIDEVVNAFAGHEACSADPQIGSASFHPTARGHQTYSAAVASAISGLIDSGISSVGRTASAPGSDGSDSTTEPEPGQSPESDDASPQADTSGENDGQGTDDGWDSLFGPSASGEDADGSGAQDDPTTGASGGDSGQDVAADGSNSDVPPNAQDDQPNIFS